MSVTLVMVFGPFPNFVIERLKALLDQQGATYRVFYSQDELDHFQKHNQSRGYERYPQFHNANLLFIDIPDDSVLIVKSELDKAGQVVVEKYQGELDTEEYLCPQCDFSSDFQGTCPEHKIPLVVFEEWNDLQKSSESQGSLSEGFKKSGSEKYLGIFIIILAAGIFLLSMCDKSVQPGGGFKLKPETSRSYGR